MQQQPRIAPAAAAAVNPTPIVFECVILYVYALLSMRNMPLAQFLIARVVLLMDWMLLSAAIDVYNVRLMRWRRMVTDALQVAWWLHLTVSSSTRPMYFVVRAHVWTVMFVSLIRCVKTWCDLFYTRRSATSAVRMDHVPDIVSAFAMFDPVYEPRRVVRGGGGGEEERPGGPLPFSPQGLRMFCSPVHPDAVKDLSGGTCSVCHEPFAETACVALNCSGTGKHVFHASCAAMFLAYKLACPLCRTLGSEGITAPPARTTS